MTAGLLLLLLLASLVPVWFLLPFVLRKLETRRLDDACRHDRTIVLTYDDGPSPAVSAPLLDLLAEQGAPATFFVIGKQACERPDLIQRLQRAGHEIANHTQSHTNAWKVTPWATIRDMRAGQNTLQDLGIRSQLFRPPYGKTTLASLAVRLLNRLRFAYWTIDTQDSWDRRPVRDILEEIERKGGGVVLMHDFDHPRRGPAVGEHLDYLLDLTRQIIELARRNNMELRRFSDLADRRNRGSATS